MHTVDFFPSLGPHSISRFPFILMNLPIDKLKQYLQRILDGSLVDPELTAFVHLSRSIVDSHFRLRGTAVRWMLDQHGMSLVELELDCIAEVFALAPGGMVPRIAVFVRSLSKELQESPDLEVFLAYKAHQALPPPQVYCIAPVMHPQYRFLWRMSGLIDYWATVARILTGDSSSVDAKRL